MNNNEMSMFEQSLLNASNDDEYAVTLPYTEMATIGRSIDDNFLVVTPDSGRNNAYFKYCNHKSYESCTAVIRLDFMEVKYYNHIVMVKNFGKLVIKNARL